MIRRVTGLGETVASPHAARATDPEAQVARALLGVLSERLDLGDGQRSVLAAVGEPLGWDGAALWLPDRDTQQLRCTAFWSRRGLERFAAATRATLFPAGVGLPGQVWQDGRPAWVDDVPSDASFLRYRAAIADGVHHALAFPLFAGDRFVGVIEGVSVRPVVVDGPLVAAVDSLASVLGSIIDRGQDERERTRLLGQVQTERARLQAVLRQLPIGVVITDAADEVILANDAVERLVGPPGPDGHYRLATSVERGWQTLPSVTSLAESGPVRDVELEVRTPTGDAAVLSMSSVPVRDRHGQVVSGVTTLVDVTHRHAERARFELLAEAGDILARSLDIEETLHAIADVTVPGLADVCLIDLLDSQGDLVRVANAVVDDATREIIEQLTRDYAAETVADEGVSRVIRTGQPSVYLDIDPAVVRAVAVDDEHFELLRRLELRGAVVVPLVGRGRTLGTLTFLLTRARRRFAEPEIDLAVELGRRAGLAVTNAQLYERSRQVADALQSSLLPPTLPMIPFVDLGACFVAGGEGLIVGGDFYDVFELDDGRWAVIVGDVCGTGAEAAAVTAHVRFTARAVEERGDPTALLKRLNHTLRHDREDDGRFCTVVYAVLEGRDLAHVEIASGGHPTPLVLRAGGRVDALTCKGSLLGVLDDVVHRADEVDLDEGDALVLYTDGVIEARGPGGFFGEDRLREVLRDLAGMPAQRIANAVANAALAHTGGPAEDDIAVVVVSAS